MGGVGRQGLKGEGATGNNCRRSNCILRGKLGEIGKANSFHSSPAPPLLSHTYWEGRREKKKKGKMRLSIRLSLTCCFQEVKLLGKKVVKSLGMKKKDFLEMNSISN